jgi:hypothetical protein
MVLGGRQVGMVGSSVSWTWRMHWHRAGWLHGCDTGEAVDTFLDEHVLMSGMIGYECEFSKCIQC